MIFWRYTKFLERENETLKSRIESLEARNQELVLALFTKASIILPNPPKPIAHKIKISENLANCTCGWHLSSDDPAELQQKISEHYRKSTAPLGRSSTWPSVKLKLEAEGEESNGN